MTTAGDPSSVARTSAAIASATARAVCAVRASGEWTISRGRPCGTGRAGESCGRASRAPASAACRSPAADSGVSDCPWKRFSTIHSDSPWRRRTSVASRPSGISGASAAGRSADGPPLTGRRPGGRPRCRSSRPRRRSPRPRRAGTSSSSARTMYASARGADRARVIELMLTSAAPSSAPTRPTVPGRSRWCEMSITPAGARSISCSWSRTRRGSPLATVPARVTV